VAVELPLSVPLDDYPGCDLLGVIDLLLLSDDGDVVAVDHKSAKNQISQGNVDQDLQLSVYNFLLRESGYTDYEKPLNCQFNVLRKLKKPKIEKLQTIRYQEDSRRMLKILGQVLYGIEQRVYMPCKSWMCSNCEFPTACKEW
jgi:putative RecB family exonuclease